jgi:hypothetical protein
MMRVALWHSMMRQRYVQLCRSSTGCMQTSAGCRRAGIVSICGEVRQSPALLDRIALASEIRGLACPVSHVCMDEQE